MTGVVDDLLDHLPYGPATLLLLVENCVIFALALAGGHVLIRLFRRRPVAPPPPPLRREEIALAAITVALNTAVTVAGLALYRAGLIHLRRDVGLRALLDVPILLLAMDAAMYVLHRLAHVEPFFTLLHRPHHRYRDPRPLTLFVLSPPETIAFGLLWLTVLYLYSASWLGMSIYLALNVLFGVVGHLGVEPLPDRWVRWPALRSVATSTFHARHHQQERSNFGFYTLLWDRLFNTLAPHYARDFGRPAAEEISPPEQ